MIPLLILGGVLVVAAVFLLAPVRLEVTFREEFTLSVRYLFFRFPLFPGEGQEEQEAPVHEETASQEGEPSKPSLGQKLRVILRREGLQGFLQTLKEPVSYTHLVRCFPGGPGCHPFCGGCPLCGNIGKGRITHGGEEVKI